MDKKWKRHERVVANQLGSTRIPNNGSGQPDMVIDIIGRPYFSVEHKSRGRNPSWLLDAHRQSRTNALEGTMPIVIHTFYGEQRNVQVVSMDLDVFKKILDRLYDYEDLRDS